MKIIFGLGNPGNNYKNTYHNLGFMAADEIAARLNVRYDKKTMFGLCAQTMKNGEKIILVKPETFMNDSGKCVAAFCNFYKCSTQQILVIYDDIDLDKGAIRFRPHGSSGTHNGMRSIVSCIGSENFPRIRIGSKNTNPNIPLVEYVLMNITSSERETLADAVNKAADCALSFIGGDDAESIMCAYNGK